jgi:hypothetical protein
VIGIYAAATVCSAADVAKMVDALTVQEHRDFAPAWSRLPVTPRFFTDKAAIPAGMPTVLVADVCDDPEALAYHTEGLDGSITGLVGAKTILDAGGTLFEGSVSISGALSHEFLETRIDPFVDAWIAMPDGQNLIAFESCDPVQDGYYEIAGVAVSNFVLPHYFDQNPPRGVKFDHLGELEGSFTRTAGGYFVVMRAGKVTQVGAERPPWKARAPLARTMRRAARVALVA